MMKITLSLLMLASVCSAQTPPIIPRANLEGSIGLSTRTFKTAFFGTMTVNEVYATRYYGSGAMLTGIVYSETDPIFNASAAKSITTSSTTYWNTAYGWGNHAGLYPTVAQLTSTASALTAEISNRINADLLLIPSSATGTYPLSISGNAATANTANTADSVQQGGVNLSTVTTALGLKVDKTGDTMSGQLTTTSTITVQGSAFSVGGSTLVVTNGRVGIGNTAPGYDFSVKGVAPTMSMESGEGQADTLYLRSTVNRWHIQRTGVYDLQFYDYGGTAGVRLALKSGGNIGIGTIVPADKLDIASGTIRMAGTGAPTTGGALCLNAVGQMRKCTSAVDASGNCTCP